MPKKPLSWEESPSASLPPAPSLFLSTALARGRAAWQSYTPRAAPLFEACSLDKHCQGVAGLTSPAASPRAGTAAATSKPSPGSSPALPLCDLSGSLPGCQCPSPTPSRPSPSTSPRLVKGPGALSLHRRKPDRSTSSQSPRSPSPPLGGMTLSGEQMPIGLSPSPAKREEMSWKLAMLDADAILRDHAHEHTRRFSMSSMAPESINGGRRSSMDMAPSVALVGRAAARQ